MVIAAKLCILFSIGYLIKIFLYPFFKPISNKQKSRARRYIRERKKEAFKEKVKAKKMYFANRYGKYLISSAERSRLTKIIDRLDLGIKPEEIRISQLFYVACAILVTAVMFSANRTLGYISAIFIILGWLYPIDELEKTIEKKNRSIALDFPAFYSMVYYQYSKSVNIFLADVIKDYVPNANPDMADELGVMLDNIDYGELYALKQLKKRVPLRYIIKFCDIMETRLKGYDNISQMAYLKNEFDEFRIRALEDELEKRERTNSRLQMILIVVLVVYIIIYYLFTVLDSFKLFQ